MKITRTTNNQKSIKISKKEWESIGKKAGWFATENWEVTNDPKNQHNCPELIGKVFIEPPSYCVVKKTNKEADFEDYRDMKTRQARSKSVKTTADTGQTYKYYIDLNERGSFIADVRNPHGETVCTIKAGDELESDESSIFEDGFMEHEWDLKGLKEYLTQLGIMKPQDELVDGIKQERELEPAEQFDRNVHPFRPTMAPGQKPYKEKDWQYIRKLIDDKSRERENRGPIG